MDNYKIGDWIVITKGGYGTYSKNTGCVCQIEIIRRLGCIVIKQDRLNEKDGSKFHYLSKGCYRLATPEEIPIEINHEPKYEIY